MFYGKFIFSQSGMPNFLGGAWFPLLVPPSSAFFSVSIHLRGRPFNFWGGGGGWFWKKISCKAILNKKNTCTNKLGGKISCPCIWWGKKCCKTAWLQGSIWPVREDQLVWFPGTSVMLISCWKTPQNAGNSLSELQKIQNFLGGHAPRPL